MPNLQKDPTKMMVIIVIVIIILLSLLSFSTGYGFVFFFFFEVNLLIYSHIDLWSLFTLTQGQQTQHNGQNHPQISFFFLINKFVLEHRHTYSFKSCLCLLLSSNGRVKQLGQTPDTIQLTKPKVFTFGPHREKIGQLLLTSIQEYVKH